MEEENEIAKIIAVTNKSIKRLGWLIFLYKVSTLFVGLTTLVLFAVYYRLGASPENYIISCGLFCYAFYTATIESSKLRLFRMELRILLYNCEKRG